jgi:hypothetical protein
MSSTFNANNTIIVDVPSSTYKVELEAIISTHGYDDYGCCEFLPTKHIFTINKKQYVYTFDEGD